MFEYLHHEHPELFVLLVHPGMAKESKMLAGYEHMARALDVDPASLPWDNGELHVHSFRTHNAGTLIG